MIEMENEKADEWARERLDTDDINEDSEEYKSLIDDYFNLQEFLREQAEFEEELQWLKANGSSIIHKSFLGELADLKKLAQVTNSIQKNTIYRMIFAHAVTLLEAFLGDTIKSLVSEQPKFFKNSMKIDELRKAKYSLEYLADNDIDAKGLAIKELSNILYHNIPKAKRIFELTLDKRIEIDISELDRITKVRHDIVHRNGKTKDGQSINLNQSDLLEMITLIENFSNELQMVINRNA
ncbi:MAG: HEPN domain-containing protein [Candidatus Thiodiazotropha endolucinida]